MTFEVGSLVKLKEDESNMLFKISEVISNDDATLIIVTDEDGFDTTYNENELTLVRKEEDILVHDHVAQPLVPVEAKRTVEDIHQDICDMFAQVFNMTAATADGRTVDIKIKAESNGKDCDVEFIVGMGGYGGIEITSDNLFTSAEHAMQRFSQDKQLKPRRLKLYNDPNDMEY